MPQSPDLPSYAGPELPKFSDRLPDLVQVLRHCGTELESAKLNQTYIPYWEDIYAVAHSLKGVLGILSCPPNLGAAIITLNENLLLGLSGPKICRKVREAGALFSELGTILDAADLNQISNQQLQEWNSRFRDLYQDDLEHEQRLKEIPAHLFYINEFVSKKAREIILLNMNHVVAEDEILLDEIPLWRTQLAEALLFPEFGRGIIVNFLPFISPEGSRQLKVWAWVAATSHSRAGLKQRIKEIMPKVLLGKI